MEKSDKLNKRSVGPSLNKSATQSDNICSVEGCTRHKKAGRPMCGYHLAETKANE